MSGPHIEVGVVGNTTGYIFVLTYLLLFWGGAGKKTEEHKRQ
jgi:hypothetical protein